MATILFYMVIIVALFILLVSMYIMFKHEDTVDSMSREEVIDFIKLLMSMFEKQHKENNPSITRDELTKNVYDDIINALDIQRLSSMFYMTETGFKKLIAMIVSSNVKI